LFCIVALCATCSVNFILDLIILIVFGAEYSYDSHYKIFFQPPVTFFS